MSDKYDIVIIGGGLSGLSAALELEKFNLKILVLEKEDRVGGRVKTDSVDGFRLDRGFQVYLSDYPDGKDILDYAALDLKAFKSGALCFSDYEKFEVLDPRRHKLALPKMAFSPVGSFMDKIRMGNLNARLQAASIDEIFDRPEHTTLDYLHQHRFSNHIIERFFRPFFGGIFLEQKLETSSRMFEFVMKMFGQGLATVPAKGMEEIPKQMKDRLKHTQFRFHSDVKEVRGNEIVMGNSENITCDHIIIATQPDQLLKQVESSNEWRNSATYYFSAEKSILKDNIIGLNYRNNRLVNSVTEMSAVSEAYAPKGSHLMSVSLAEVPNKAVEEVTRDIKNELALTFGESVQGWKFLRNYHIRKSLPAPASLAYDMPISETMIREGVYLAGDYLLHGSINAALRSGKLAAQQAVLHFDVNR